jgi:DNA-binding MarR family transcriptional regulator
MQTRSNSTDSASSAADGAGDTARQTGEIAKAEYEAIAGFRYAIRRYLRFSEQAARAAGITPQQHQLMLAIKGFPNRERATISELADRLQMRQHSMVGLVDRTEAQGLVRREHGVVDRRQVFVSLTPSGEETLRRLIGQHRRELANMRNTLVMVGEAPAQ